MGKYQFKLGTYQALNISIATMNPNKVIQNKVTYYMHTDKVSFAVRLKCACQAPNWPVDKSASIYDMPICHIFALMSEWCCLFWWFLGIRVTKFCWVTSFLAILIQVQEEDSSSFPVFFPPHFPPLIGRRYHLSPYFLYYIFSVFAVLSPSLALSIIIPPISILIDLAIQLPAACKGLQPSAFQRFCWGQVDKLSSHI